LTSESQVLVVDGDPVEIRAHNCFACGTLNEHGLRLDLHLEAGRSWTDLELDGRFEGWDGIAHGGVVATILDEVMAWALVSTDAWGLTAKMSVEFRAPVEIGRRVHAEGELVAARKRVFRTTGRLSDRAGRVLARAGATYIAAPPERKRALQDRYGFRRVPTTPVVEDGPRGDRELVAVEHG
jgi:acyl-coenzyme A thioesterase PaaI-like protein